MSTEIVIKEIAALFEIDSAAILSRSRRRNVADARMVCCYILHRCLVFSSPDVGRLLGLNHATVLHAVRNCEEWLDDGRVNPRAKQAIETITKQIYDDRAT